MCDAVKATFAASSAVKVAFRDCSALSVLRNGGSAAGLAAEGALVRGRAVGVLVLAARVLVRRAGARLGLLALERFAELALDVVLFVARWRRCRFSHECTSEVTTCDRLSLSGAGLVGESISTSVTSVPGPAAGRGRRSARRRAAAACHSARRSGPVAAGHRTRCGRA